ncbi:MAG: hypothetical protein ACREIW_07285 [Chthoniobacterales bacterium]
MLPLLERFYARKGIFRSSSAFAAERFRMLRTKFERGETLYLGGICAAGTHNSGVALIEVTPKGGPRIICNNEEERFSGERHTTKFPHRSIDALTTTLRKIGIEPSRVDGWFSAWDNAALGATILSTVMEEAPASLSLLRQTQLPIFNLEDAKRATRAARNLGRDLGCATPVIAMPHHDCPSSDNLRQMAV